MIDSIKYVSFRAVKKTINCYIKMLKHRHMMMRGVILHNSRIFFNEKASLRIYIKAYHMNWM